MENQERFWNLAIPEPNSGCWLWLGSTFHSQKRSMGYGRYGKHSRLAHRVSWELTHGDPGEAHVCHRCDNVLCVNPDHLYLGDNASNAADKVSRGRQPRGSRIRPSKLSEDRVRFIRANMATPNGELARELGVSVNVIWNVKNGLCWGWVK